MLSVTTIFPFCGLKQPNMALVLIPDDEDVVEDNEYLENQELKGLIANGLRTVRG